MNWKAIVRANVTDLLANVDKYYGDSLTIGDHFGGPSVYFHLRAIDACRTAFLSDQHLEYTYATLASWGLHRMGDTDCKMVMFGEFRSSVLEARQYIDPCRTLRLGHSDIESALRVDGPIHRAYEAIRVSKGRRRLVANSKVLHHLLPDLIPPVDQQYTLRFFYRHRQDFANDHIPFPKTSEDQYEAFCEICLEAKAIIQQLERVSSLQPFDDPKHPFNTSWPKVVDNLIVAFVRAERARLNQ